MHWLYCRALVSVLLDLISGEPDDPSSKPELKPGIMYEKHMESFWKHVWTGLAQTMQICV